MRLRLRDIELVAVIELELLYWSSLRYCCRTIDILRAWWGQMLLLLEFTR